MNTKQVIGRPVNFYYHPTKDVYPVLEFGIEPKLLRRTLKEKPAKRLLTALKQLRSQCGSSRTRQKMFDAELKRLAGIFCMYEAQRNEFNSLRFDPQSTPRILGPREAAETLPLHTDSFSC